MANPTVTLKTITDYTSGL